MIPTELYLNIINAMNCSIHNNKYHEFIHELDGEITFDEEYEAVYYRQRISFVKLIPAQILQKYFRQCLDKTIDKAYEMNMAPCMIKINIFFENSLSSTYVMKTDVNDYILEELLNELIDN